MQQHQSVHFGSYAFEPHQAQLRRGTRVLPLTRKACAVLQYLVAHPGQLVTKDALFQAVWPETVVSEGVLTNCIAELRQALGDQARRPRFIATVHGRGYRFIAPLHPPAPAPGPRSLPAPSPHTSRLVGREAELAHLHHLYTQALQGQRQVVFVTGEAGIGKTALVEAVVHTLRGDPGLGLGHGQCIEQYGAGEAYLPLLEALGQLGRALGGEHLVAILAQVAPSWAVQLPALLSAPVLADLHRTLAGATRTRMLRELAEGLEALSAARPLVLVLEDLHWSDTSTVEALALLARRREPARLLVLGTYRPVDLIVHAHPLKRVQQELAAHGQCVDLPLSELSEAAVAAYVAQRGVTPEAHAGVTAAVYRRTEGHPLFMVQMVDYLAQQDVLRATIQAATSEGAARALDAVVPPRLRQLLDAQFERLTAAEQQGLEVGSVAGVEFVVASVAAGGPTPPEAVEAVCEGLARRGQFLEDRGLVEWPDGTVSGCYGFRHALYQEVVYQQMSAGRRVRCHQAIGARLEQAYGTRTHEVAAELAMHFERGRDYRRAVQYLQQAAENAAQRYASHEVIALLTKGLELLATLPETPARAQQELALKIALGPAWRATQGPAAPEVEQTYTRARVLCQQIGEPPHLFATLRGLCNFYFNRGALLTAQELGEQLVHLAERAADPLHRLEEHVALGLTLIDLGDYAAARTHLEQGIALTDPATQRALALRQGEASGVRCLAAARTLWCLVF